MRYYSHWMSDYVLAHGGDDAERRRMALLFEYSGPLTIRQIEAAGIGPGSRCLEVGAGGGQMTAWLAERVAPAGRVLAVDLETHWLEPLRSPVVEVALPSRLPALGARDIWATVRPTTGHLSRD